MDIIIIMAIIFSIGRKKKKNEVHDGLWRFIERVKAAVIIKVVLHVIKN